MAAYERAAMGEALERVPRQRGAPGTFARLLQDYFSSPDYLRLAPSTQKTYRSVMERLLSDENIGHRLVREMGRGHVHRLMSKRVETPGAANSVLQKLKVLMHFAIDNGWRRDDPTLRIKKFAGGEFHTWTEDEIARFERRWPVGTTARLAFALLLFTGQRRSDVVRMSPADVHDGTIGVIPLKTKRSSGVKLWIPIHPELADVLAETDQDGETILRTAFGAPFTSNGFGNFMADKIGRADLPNDCVTHGLRKAAARRLAEAGCTANEIAAITGHATLQEVSRYTKAAEQRRLAKAAMERLTARSTAPVSQTSATRLGKLPKTLKESRGADERWWSRGESNP
jgi:enterobacteria phage integrase